TSVALQIGTDLTMTPTTPAEQKEIELIEINNATLTFKDGDKPVFTGTTPDGAPYVLVFEEWRTDGEWTRSDEWFNDADHHGSDKDITAFDKNKSYNYNLYLKTTAEGSEEGWYFGSNTKLKINGKEVSFTFTNNDPGVFMVTTGITMTPIAAGASDYKIIEGANGAWTQNTDGTLTVRANGDFSKFTDVKVDGTPVDEENYTAVAGSTVITLHTDYLKTLSVGTHKLTVAYTDGECSTNFEVKKAASEQTKPAEEDKPDATTPAGDKKATILQTGDNSHLLLWAVLLFGSGAGVIGTTVYGRKRKHSAK
ncbi:MAG: X2-like carbohydrate binding domain-containing protein, partial [Oscillospiraceae bacterium]